MREREGQLRELSEKINSDAYRYTLLQIFVLRKRIFNYSDGSNMADEAFKVILCYQKTSLIKFHFLNSETFFFEFVISIEEIAALIRFFQSSIEISASVKDQSNGFTSSSSSVISLYSS
jgi:hypothetical protein